MKTISYNPITPVQPLGNGKYYLHYNIEQTRDFQDNECWSADTIKLTGEPSYGAMVAALIGQRYTRDEMEAIVNNYLADPADTDGEFAEMQAWRARAKAIAKEALGDE